MHHPHPHHLQDQIYSTETDNKIKKGKRSSYCGHWAYKIKNMLEKHCRKDCFSWFNDSYKDVTDILLI